jgi:hypothetical protein
MCSAGLGVFLWLCFGAYPYSRSEKRRKEKKKKRPMNNKKCTMAASTAMPSYKIRGLDGP